MKKLIALVICFVLVLSLSAGAFAVNEDVEGTIGIYSSMYQFVIDMMDEALKAEFPNLTPAFDGSFFFYGGTSSLITKIYGEMETGTLGCDMMLVAEPAFSLELKEAGYLEPIAIDGADTLLKAGSDRIRLQYPENGASATSMGCAMIKGCPHPEAAKAMINFLMSPEGQKAIATRLETLRFTNPKAKYTIKYLPPDDTIKWVTRDVKWLTAHKAELLEKWNALYTETR